MKMLVFLGDFDEKLMVAPIDWEWELAGSVLLEIFSSSPTLLRCNTREEYFNEAATGEEARELLHPLAHSLVVAPGNLRLPSMILALCPALLGQPFLFDGQWRMVEEYCLQHNVSLVELPCFSIIRLILLGGMYDSGSLVGM